MTKKRRLIFFMLLGYCLLVSCHSPQSNTVETSAPEKQFETGTDMVPEGSQIQAAWYLADHMDDESVIVSGYQESSDYPYGYNVGRIEDDVVGNAILITPDTSITAYGSFNDISFLHFDYILHPWTAQNSDGAILEITIEGNENKDKYTFDAKDSFQNESIPLEKYIAGEKMCITFSVRNEQGHNSECDWLVLKDVTIDNIMSAVPKVFDETGYVRSATYFGDEWPINFWNSELDHLEQDMKQIKRDGFDSIILVIPWREFQPEISPVAYNTYAFDNLDRIMRAADQEDLAVYARIGYTWDFYNDKAENIIDRYCRILGEEEIQNAWYSYVGKMYETLSAYPCFREGFLTWEDFWGTLGVCDEIFEMTRREKAAYIGYQEWVKEEYALSEYNTEFGTRYKSYESIPVPRRDEPAMAAMYSFYDDFLNELLEKSQAYFPDLSMEIRLDWDVVYTKDGDRDYYKHTDTFTCGQSYYTATMYGIPMGFSNTGERVSYDVAMEKTEYMLKLLKSQNENKPVYVEQFLFADNTPAFVNNARIKEEELNTYLESIAPVMLENSEGYGIWTYRNYCANMLYNPQFALEGAGWETNGTVSFEEKNGSMTCFIEQGGSVNQSVGKIRNHFALDTYYVTFDIVEVIREGKMTVSLGGKKQTVEVSNETEKICLDFPAGSSFNLEIVSKDCAIKIDNVKLYSQVQQGFLYDENNDELMCIEGIRSLNSQLAEQSDDMDLSTKNDYMISAHYFADGWPMNFWNAGWDMIDQDLEQIKRDGFNTIIVVVPWREFQPGINPTRYDEEIWDRLHDLIETAEKHGLNVQARAGYLHDFAGQDDAAGRFYDIVYDPTTKEAWKDFMGRLYTACSEHDNFTGAFITWEDFWHNYCLVDYVGGTEAGLDYARRDSFGVFLNGKYTLNEFNSKYNTDFEDFYDVYIPSRQDGYMREWYEFIDNFTMELLSDTRNVFPGLFMEVRTDNDYITDENGDRVLFSHAKTWDCAGAEMIGIMYKISQGLSKEDRESLTAEKASQGLRNWLQNVYENNGKVPIYIEQYLFYDNTPGFSNGYLISDLDADAYFTGCISALKEYTNGYGVWTYRDYCSNVLYNPGFTLSLEGWTTEGNAVCGTRNSDNEVRLSNGTISQDIPAWRKYVSEESNYIFTMDYFTEDEAVFTVSVGGEDIRTVVTGEGNLCLNLADVDDMCVSVSCDGDAWIDNLKLYNFVATSELYDTNNKEKKYIGNLRSLNVPLTAD